MSIPQPKFREVLFQVLYSYDISQASDELMLELLMKELAVTRKAVKQAQEKAQHIRLHFSTLDKMIGETSTAYDFERIQSVERNVMRLALYEMLHDDSIPAKVAISEGVRLAKKFASPESAKFVNAILDHIYKASLGEQTDSESIIASAAEMKKHDEFNQQLLDKDLTSVDDQDENE